MKRYHSAKDKLEDFDLSSPIDSEYHDLENKLTGIDQNLTKNDFEINQLNNEIWRLTGEEEALISDRRELQAQLRAAARDLNSKMGKSSEELAVEDYLNEIEAKRSSILGQMATLEIELKRLLSHRAYLMEIRKIKSLVKKK